MNKKILIITANYYKDIAQNLTFGATKYCASKNIEADIIEVSGSFEIPFIISKKRNFYDGFVALGCVIRGETYHFELISNQVSRKIMDLSIEISKPIGFGILTCENIEQAFIRSDPEQKNKGSEAASACIDLLNFK
ncbi:MAG: 6,7-dimethyl-8-ribityllumazine synthase 1 [Alphaproteobacteria bacterium MarineAlpha5_Bin9]|nr:MAG: 6,7-dimethyl-8-ribityllumazine synthase 1 [Alphaproteobacteria bacterium MarineAlpha5_Bin9]|tara:strand:+ start:4090 stop:4497 length:408 start_codon:yes stop_codon:yes gene_type:complete